MNCIYLLKDSKNNFYRVVKDSSNHQECSVLFQVACDDEAASVVLNKLKKNFDYNDEGNYFNGNHNTMIDVIYTTVKQQSQPSTIDQAIVDEFPEYQFDESFGGKKKFVKISANENRRSGRYFSQSSRKENEYLISYLSLVDGKVTLESYTLQYDKHGSFQELYELIGENALKVNYVYNVNDDDFVNLLNSKKRRIVVEEMKLKPNSHLFSKIERLFITNVILNDVAYGDAKTPSHDGDGQFIVEIRSSAPDGSTENALFNDIIMLITLDGKYYEYTYLISKNGL